MIVFHGRITEPTDGQRLWFIIDKKKNRALFPLFATATCVPSRFGRSLRFSFPRKHRQVLIRKEETRAHNNDRLDRRRQRGNLIILRRFDECRMVGLAILFILFQETARSAGMSPFNFRIQ